ncbi:MAG: tRNA uridine-5-carboxymethylaminomethyl(34) synthesis enzyme MnmG [Muribaculaceae bacterium]|nr:tRNA uridine-5-carboxymethylaminomethyl(34) synthesis enzyme MnmG [Muribaculaceae bacterium]
MRLDYDVIVVGAGHAGCEAACAAAHLGSATLLITIDMNKVAQMSCNPAVGGIAKGQIVREIDALGGQMGIVTDRSSIQFRMLNRSKGPAMWSPRSQCDRMHFMAEWRKTLEATPNLYMWQDSVTGLTFASDGSVAGVSTALGMRFSARSVVLTTGTFLNGLMHVGRVQQEGGRVCEPAAHGLTEQLVARGFKSDRMKTGTPVRIDGRTIDYTQTTVQEGDERPSKFSFLPHVRSALKQRPCWIVYTNPEVHRVLNASLDESPLYNGQITSIGPRYCPSIETKIVTFADKEAHQLFIEPEGEDTQEMYLNGFSSSLPASVQFEALSHIPALAHAQYYRPGYAIEYDFFDPTQLHHTLETKLVKGLFFAGQINGTTGYEEAAAQGLVAGINAHLARVGEEPFVLQRDEAYIGVLIDDLVTKGVDEPYRMFTSRAEYRILLRQDDADVRLTSRAYQLGLATEERYQLMLSKQSQVAALIAWMKDCSVRPDEINEALAGVGQPPLRQAARLYDLLLRPQFSIAALADVLPAFAEQIDRLETLRRDEILEAVEVRVKYSGYIEREQAVADKLRRLEEVCIDGKFDYESIHQLSTEARQKLSRIRPATIGQASRIPGISPSDVNILLLLLGR